MIRRFFHHNLIIKEPSLCRREALRKWQSKQGLDATYGKLLKLFSDAGHTQAAEALCEILRKKCKSSIL